VVFGVDRYHYLDCFLSKEQRQRMTGNCKTVEDKKMLQAEDKLNKWSEDWLLKFNVDKCKKMTITLTLTFAP